jgi:uncharacterized protein YegP (UPF0339 family)
MGSVSVRFEIHHNLQQTQPFWWRFVATNNRIIAVSGEFYAAKSSAQHGISLVKGTTSIAQYDIYKDAASQWRFRLRATNSQIICVSSESYWNEADCRSACQLLVNTNAVTAVVDNTLVPR